MSPCVRVSVWNHELLLLPVGDILNVPGLARLVQLVVDPVLELWSVVLDLGHSLQLWKIVKYGAIKANSILQYILDIYLNLDCI